VWGNADLLGALSAAHETESARAQVDAATQEIQLGRVADGLDRLHALQRKEPQSVDAAITAIGAECSVTGRLSADTLARARRTLATTQVWNNGLYQWMRTAAIDPVTRHCVGFGLHGLRSLVDSAGVNPQLRLPFRQRSLDHVRGRIALASNDPHTALAWFDEVLRVAPDPDFALVQAAALGDAGFPALGVKHLDHYATMQSTAARSPRSMADIHAWLLVHLGFYRNELTSLRAQLAKDAEHSARHAKDSATP
jgi:predicted Zn-dependent protease